MGDWEAPLNPSETNYITSRKKDWCLLLFKAEGEATSSLMTTNQVFPKRLKSIEMFDNAETILFDFVSKCNTKIAENPFLQFEVLPTHASAILDILCIISIALKNNNIKYPVLVIL